MDAPRILIVEDDFSIASNLHAYLERRGFEIDVAYSGHAALHRVSVDRYDCVLLDIGLPGLDGHTLLHRMREELSLATPVLVISARSDLSDKLAGFEHGADDYLTKPFALAEVEARIRALVGRRQGARPSTDGFRRVGSLRFDPAAHEAWVGTTRLRLTPKAALLLESLTRRPGKLVRRHEIEAALWADDPPHPDALRAQVHGLRKALADAGFAGLETVHGLGYRIVDPRPGPT